MTASNTLLSTQSNGGAIQARANSQSAVIALMGAGSAAAETGNSFADSLEAESKRQSTPNGLFSDSREASNSAAARKSDRTRPSKKADAESPDATSPAQRAQTEDAVAPETDDRFKIVSTSKEPSPSPANKSTENPSEPGEVVAAAQQTPADHRAETPTERAATRPDEAATRGPTDPLRLIVQKSETTEDAPVQPGVTHANETNAKTDPNTKAVATGNQQHNGAGSNANGNANPSGFGIAGAAPIGRSMAAGAENAPESGGSVANVSATNGAGAGTRTGMPLDQVTPPKTGPSRPIEHPVTLKLKVTGQSGTPDSPLTDEEISAAEAQLGRGLTAAFRQNTPQVTLWMSPETLGKVRIQLTFDQGTISAKFEATSEATKDLLASNMDSLRTALQSRGLTADHIEVVSIPDWSQQSGSPSDSRMLSGGSASMSGESSQHNGQQPQQGRQEHSGTWNTMLSNFGATVESAKPDSSTELNPSVNVSKTLLKLQARLELDAVA